MKRITLLCCMFFFAQFLSAQIVNIPDANLKSKLLNYSPPIDLNADGEIQISEAQLVTELDLQFSGSSAPQISNTTGLEAFVNLTNLDLRGNLITSIDLTALTSLDVLNLNNNDISAIDVSQNINLTVLKIRNNNLSSLNLNHPDLETLDISGNNISGFDLSSEINLIELNAKINNISTIDLSQNAALEDVDLSSNPLTSLDVGTNQSLQFLYVHYTNIPILDISNNPDITYLSFFGNDVLTYVNLKNGNSSNIELLEGFYQTPNVVKVCLDDVTTFNDFYYQQLQDIGALATTNCEFDPEQVNTITGALNYNMGNGCDASTAFAVPNVIVKSENNGNNFGTITGYNGNYLLKVDEGTNVTSVISTFPSYFSVNPNSQTENFNGYGNVAVNDFCIEHSEIVEDLNVSIYSSGPIKPYAGTKYFRVTVENMGTEIVNGTLSFEYDSNAFEVLSSNLPPTSSTEGVLTFSFYNLRPLYSYTFKIKLGRIDVVENPLTVGEVLNFTANVIPDDNDITPANNMFVLPVTVVSSYDPNNKQVLEGDEINIDQIDNYLHYIVNFQNTGNANADRVMIADDLSQELDWNTLRMVSASDDYRVEITNNNHIEFIFENIDLPFESADEEGSHGYIAYKIKPKGDIAVGDVIQGDAAIYFDYNEPIITNNVSTEIVENLPVNPITSLENIQLYPNPTTGIVNISNKNEIEFLKVEVFDISGKRLLVNKNKERLNFENFSAGIYFVKIKDSEGNQAVKKVIKK